MTDDAVSPPDSPDATDATDTTDIVIETAPEVVPEVAAEPVPAPSSTPEAATGAADLRQVVEALLFASPKPLTARQIATLLNKSNETHGADFHLFREVSEDQIFDVILQMKEEYAAAIPTRGLHLQQIAGGFRFGTRPETATWVRQLFDETRPAKLSQPALETLSIIAYRQPISRADVEAVRGVAVDGVVTTLLERRLIKLAGRSEAPGRPLLYETTPEFLEAFGLKALDELPNADELRRIPLPVQQPTPQSRAEAEHASEGEAEIAPTPAGAATEPMPETETESEPAEASVPSETVLESPENEETEGDSPTA